MNAIKSAKNQTLFREVNERIRNLDYSVSRAEFVCECVRPECSETIEMSLAEPTHVNFGTEPVETTSSTDITVTSRCWRRDLRIEAIRLD